MMDKKEWTNARLKSPFLKWREIVPKEDRDFEILNGEPVYNDKVIVIHRGEEIAIPRRVLERDYYIENPEHKKKFPIVIEDEESLELIEKAKKLEWYAEHAIRNYRGKMDELFIKICEDHGVDREKIAIRLDGNPPTLYYMGDILPSTKDENNNDG